MVVDDGALPLAPHVTWWELSLGFAAADVVFDIHLDIHSDTYSISLMEIPLVIGLFLANPLAVVGGHVIGTGLALALYRRQPPLKLFFNVSLLALESAVAVTVFRAIVGPLTELGPKTWAPALAAVVVANLVSCLGVMAVIALNGGASGSAGASVRRVGGARAVGQHVSRSWNGRGAAESAGLDRAARGHRRGPRRRLSGSCVAESALCQPPTPLRVHTVSPRPRTG